MPRQNAADLALQKATKSREVPEQKKESPPEDITAESGVAVKSNHLRRLIEAKQERQRQFKRKEEEKKVDEKRLADLARARPGEGFVNWDGIVSAKRRKKKEREERERESKPDPYNLDRKYNCVQHIQDQFIDSNSVKTEGLNILLYRKVLPCPLRSQINNAKARLLNGENTKAGAGTDQDHIQEMIGTFLNERGAEKLLPERDFEIDRLTNLVDQLKLNLKDFKARRAGLESRRQIQQQEAMNRHMSPDNSHLGIAKRRLAGVTEHDEDDTSEKYSADFQASNRGSNRTKKVKATRNEPALGQSIQEHYRECMNLSKTKGDLAMGHQKINKTSAGRGAG